MMTKSYKMLLILIASFIVLAASHLPAYADSFDSMESYDLPESAAASWAYVETVTVNGFYQSVPGGKPLTKLYSAGTYKFVIAANSTGISYWAAQGYPYGNTCFLGIWETDAHEYHSMSLSQADNKNQLQYTSGSPIYVDFFIYDSNRADNAGAVKIKVYRLL